MAEQIGSIFSTVGVNLEQLSQGINTVNKDFKGYGNTLKNIGASLSSFADQLSTTIGRALRWYIAYRLIRTTLGGLGKALEDIKRLQVQEIFTPLIFQGKEMQDVFKQASKLAIKWGEDVYVTYESIIRFGRVLKDFDTSVYLTDVALETMRASGQGLNEIVTSMIGLITNLDISVSDAAEAMDILYSAALKTDEPMDLLGQSFKGGVNALQSFTDAMDQGALGLQNLGFSFGQIAAIFNILITQTDRTGQSIGSLFAKLAGGLKNNQQLLDIYKQVGVQLEYSQRLLGLLASGWEKMNINQKNAVISAAGVAGIGRDLVEVFFKSLPDALQRYDEILSDVGLRENMASQMMDTIAGKEARLKTATQLLGLSFKEELLPPLTTTIELLTYLIRKTTLAAETFTTLFIKTPFKGAQQFYELFRLPTLKEGFVESLRNRYRAIMSIGRDFEKDLKELGQKYITEAQWDDMLEKGMLPDNLEKGIGKSIKDMFTNLGVDDEDTQMVEDASRLIRKYHSQINTATSELGVFASKQETNQIKAKLLKEEISELTRILPNLTDEMSRLEVQEELSKANNELEDMETHYKNISEYSLRLSQALKETPPTQREVLDYTRSIRDEFEDIASRRIVDIIKGTGTFRDLLSDIGDVVLEELIKKLVSITLGGQAPGGGLFGIFASVLGSVFAGGVQTKHLGGEVLPRYSLGGEILPRFQFGGEVPVLAKPGEYIVREGPAQKYKGLLKALNEGKDIPQEETQNHYYIHAVDAASFFELVRRNPEAIHYAVRQAKRLNKSGFRTGD